MMAVPIGHLGINVSDLALSRAYYDVLMPVLGFEVFVSDADQVAYRPAGGKPGTYLFLYPALDPDGFLLEAVCHHDRA